MPKGSEKRRVGRPGVFDDPADFRARCEEYFELLKFQDDGKTPRENIDPPNITELAQFLGFADRNGFNAQTQRGDEYLAVVEWCRGKIRIFYEKRVSYTDAGAMAWLRRNAADEWGEDKAGPLVEISNGAIIPKISFVAPKPLPDEPDGEG